MQVFGISEPEALLLDPQQRLVLETVHEALSEASALRLTSSGPDATSSPELMRSKSAVSSSAIGVYVGVASSDHGAVVARYHTAAGAGGGGGASAAGPYHASANALSVVAGRVSFVFGLTGKLSARFRFPPPTQYICAPAILPGYPCPRPSQARPSLWTRLARPR